MRTPLRSTLAAVLAGVVLAGCQGMPSEKPPIHVNPNMDWMAKYKPQDANAFFEDGRSNRAPVEGTVARGSLLDATYETGRTPAGAFVPTMPVDIDKAFLYRGKERFQIYCAPCHGGTGAGDGLVIASGYVRPPNFHDATIRSMPDGQLYSAIYDGVRTMPSYRAQIPVEDRWAIVAYIRALQRSQNATAADLTRLGVDASTIASN